MAVTRSLPIARLLGEVTKRTFREPAANYV